MNRDSRVNGEMHEVFHTSYIATRRRQALLPKNSTFAACWKQVVCGGPTLRGRRQALPHIRSDPHTYEGQYFTTRCWHASDFSHLKVDCRCDKLSALMSSERITRGSLAPHSKDTCSFRHFVKTVDQSCSLEEGCSSARRAPSS